MIGRSWRARGLALLVPGAFAIVHCEKSLEQFPEAPNNDCREHPCKAFDQVPPADCAGKDNYCFTNNSFAYSIVITMPSGMPALQDATVALTSEDLKPNPSVQPPSDCERLETCIVISLPGTSTGTYDVDPTVAERVGRKLSNTASSQHTSLPVRAAFLPLGPGPFPPDAVATDRGFPLLGQGAKPVSVLPGTLPETLPPGPFGSPTIGWAISLPVGSYRRVLMPEPPFDDAFPPREDIVQVTRNTTARDLVTLTLDDPATRRFTITPENGALDLKGFTAVLQNSITHRNISRVVTLGSGSNDVTLFTSGFKVLQDKPVELVVAPPPGRDGIPSLIGQGQPSIPATQTYPRFKLPVSVIGSVQAFGAPALATVVIQSAFIETYPPNFVLRYATQVQTDASGLFRVKLPPGRYDVAVYPENDPDLALWTSLPASTPGVDAGSGAGADNGTGAWVVPDDNPVLKKIELVSKATMSGEVELGDGTPLAYAEIEAHAAAEPSSIPPAAVPPFSLPPFARAARTAQTYTDMAGKFSLSLDPGEYDIVVRPKDGTRFPWIVATARKMGGKNMTLGRLKVPVPVVITRTIYAETPNAPVPVRVRNALVRVFAIPPGKRVAVEIGRTFTGTDGKLELFLAGPPN